MFFEEGLVIVGNTLYKLAFWFGLKSRDDNNSKYINRINSEHIFI